jgi:uncharacterized protein (DUF2336 family)
VRQKHGRRSDSASNCPSGPAISGRNHGERFVKDCPANITGMDVREFLLWMETAPAGSRAEAGHALARSYLHTEVDEQTRRDMEAALTILLDDEAADVRYALADALAASEDAPRHIIVGLAGDHTGIAALVLSRSPLFVDSELVDIVAASSEPLQEAVARRPLVSQSVAAAIAEVGERAACLTLIANANAAIASISFRRMAERFGDDADIRDALLGREDLAPSIRQLLVRTVSERLSAMVVDRAWLPEARARTITREACDRATIAIAAESETEELPALVEHLRVTGQLTTALLLRAVCAGNMALFQTALSVLTGVPERRIAGLVRGRRLNGLRAAYARAGLPLYAFDAFSAVLDVWRRAPEAGPEERYRFIAANVETVLTRYRHIGETEVRELTAMLRRFAAEQTREAARQYVRAVAA